jgi:8-oxo-dGTP pyrophosphatase MutT (NUDIX family)
MKQPGKRGQWTVLSKVASIESPWLTMVVERLQDDEQNEYEYWRVEKSDGMIVITVQNGHLILPEPTYRPGIGAYTLDFCGGRIEAQESLETNANAIVRRELKIAAAEPFASLTRINSRPWNVDSSFSNVHLYGYVAELRADITISPETESHHYPNTSIGIKQLLEEMECMQCRLLLREWQALRQLS